MLRCHDCGFPTARRVVNPEAKELPGVVSHRFKL